MGMTGVGMTLLECKGTTARGQPDAMIISAHRQVKGAQLQNGTVQARCLSCALVPLVDDSRGPTIWCGDPENEGAREPSIILHERMKTKAVWLHYAHVANMAGLELLAELLWRRGEGEEMEDDLSSRALVEIDRAEATSIELNGRRFLVRTLETPIRSPRAPQTGGCPRYIVSLGLDAGIARNLAEMSTPQVPNEARKITSIREQKRIVFNDGAALLLTARNNEGELDPSEWWGHQKQSGKAEE
jgi:hypothetical protein